MNHNKCASNFGLRLALLVTLTSALHAPAQESSSPYGYYYPPTPPPGAKPKNQAATPPVAPVRDTSPGPYAYPAMPSPSPTPSPKPLTELEALKRENEALRKQLSGAGPAVPSVAPAPPAPKISVPTEAYKVRRGDSLWGLALRHGTRVAVLRELNGLSSERIVEGQVLQVPVRAARPAPSPRQDPAAPPEFPPASTPPAAVHVVRSGESLGVIASRFKVSQPSLQVANKLSSPNKIYAGQKLLIPGRTQAEVAGLTFNPKPAALSKPASNQPRYVSSKNQPPAPEVIYYQPQRMDAVTSYRIQPGDTLESIATARGISRESIVRVNGLSGNTTLRPGEELILPVSSRTISM